VTGVEAAAEARFSPLVPGVTHIRYPDVYRGCAGVRRMPTNSALGCARYIEDKLFKTILAPEEVAAIFVEPNSGRRRIRHRSDHFMQEFGAICDKHGILLVVDEVQSGVGRTGKCLRLNTPACSRHRLHGEGHCLRHAVGVTVSRPRLMDWVPGSHASTFGGNPVCIAAALATLDVIEKEGLLRNSQESATTC